MNPSVLTIFQFIILIFSAIIHEVAHGLMALSLGDETAKREGRLTLNPISHIDPVGTILLPLLMIMSGSPIVFGWAKPVPYNPMALYKDFRFGPLKVALAGPFSNLALAVVFGLIIRLGGGFFSGITLQLLTLIVVINVLLCIFNLVPIPPLDGSKILTTFLPREAAFKMERLGFMGILLVFLFLYLFSDTLGKAVLFVSSLITGTSIQ